MNHKVSEPRTRLITSTHTRPNAQQQQQQQQQQHHNHSSVLSSPHSTHDDRPMNPLKDETDAEKADRLLAATLLFYKKSSTNPITNFNPSLSPLFLELQTFTQQHSLAQQFILSGDTTLEQQSARATLLTAPWLGDSTNTTMIEFLLWTITNLRKPLVSFKHSIEANARAVFNIVIASIIDGAGVQDCESLLSLCIHLKDTDSCYPLRALATSVCIEMTCEESLPLYARTSMLKFILGPAEFILHHLETRVQLSEKIDILLLKNLYEDVEFRSLVQRVAKKIGSRPPVSPLEQLKFRMYQYLQDTVSHPSRYIRPELIAKFMPNTHWVTLLDRDYIVSCYLEECRPQMLLFLDTIRTMGIAPSLLELGFVPIDTLSEGVLHVLVGQQQVQSVLSSQAPVFTKDSGILDVEGLNTAFEQVLATVIEYQDPSAELQLHLTSAGVQLSSNLKTLKGDQVDMTKVGKLLETMKHLLLSAPVAPSHFLPRLLWSAALSLEACRNLEESLGLTTLAGHEKLQEVRATCLDIFLVSVVYRSEPRFPSNTSLAATTTTEPTLDCLNEDLELCLILSCLLFPARKESTWTLLQGQDIDDRNNSNNKDNLAQLSLLGAFLTRLFEHLLPLLERIDHRSSNSKSSSALILAGVTIYLFALQLPSGTLFRDRVQIIKALEDISDMQHDCSLISSSTLWHNMFLPASPINPLNVLKTRLDALQ